VKDALRLAAVIGSVIVARLDDHLKSAPPVCFQVAVIPVCANDPPPHNIQTTMMSKATITMDDILSRFQAGATHPSPRCAARRGAKATFAKNFFHRFSSTKLKIPSK
jgi:hypothetical protein